MAVRYKGLFISATRQICIGCLPKDISQKHEAVTEIDSRLIERTREGISMEEMFQLAKDSYKDVGYEDEWKNHHQGGLSGFLSRESKAMPGNTVKVRGNQAFAWNPTIRGTKSEDTMLLFNGEQSILTETGKWQYTTKSGIRRPVIISI